MCALFGFLDYGKKISFLTKKKLIRELSVAAESRGTDATGIAYVKNKELTIFKKAKPAHKLSLYFPNDTVCVMGHTRMATQGSEKFNANNHPFLGCADKSFALAHNGVLYNDTILKRTENLPSTEIETDSYAAVQLIEKSQTLDFESIKDMAETVMGSFMFTILDEDNTLYFVKGSNPIYLIHFEDLGIFVYGSTKEIVQTAIMKTVLKYSKGNVINLAEGNILSISKNGEMTKNFFTFYEDIYMSRNYSGFDWACLYDEREESVEDVLLENCVNFGIEPDDVYALLDYGYEPEDIEMMFYEPKYLLECVRETNLF